MKLNIYSEADGPGGILPTDSTEYELLREAAALGAGVPGMGCELGVRRGGGSRMIMDEFIKAGVYKNHVMVDPWGDIDYLTNEKLVRHTYTDYTNEMRNVCMVELYSHYMTKPVNPIVIMLEDSEFFKRYADGVPCYNDKGKVLETAYCMVHLDGPHDSTVVNTEVDFFAPRMNPGAMLVCDDTNLYAHWENSHPHILQNFDEYKRGNRKIVYRRK
jgi:hypothetical protein